MDAWEFNAWTVYDRIEREDEEAREKERQRVAALSAAMNTGNLGEN